MLQCECFHEQHFDARRMPKERLLRRLNLKNDERGFIYGNGTDETACGNAAGSAADAFSASISPCGRAGVVSGTTVSGTVRVYLSSISSLTAVDLTIAGSYSVGGDDNRSLARGQNVRVSNSGGVLSMTVNGQTQTMGSRFKLRRHQTTGENGVRIAQARYPASLYPGDIEFIARGGNVQIIVHVFMEDYMLGVLPYEMDNSFPLEALKAQAVAARTYALKKMSAQAATYDVVDTTSDQVYNGYARGQ